MRSYGIAINIADSRNKLGHLRNRERLWAVGSGYGLVVSGRF